MPGIMAGPFPAAYNINLAAACSQQTRDLVGIILQVRVHSYYDFAVRSSKTGGKRRGLAEVPPQANAMDAGIFASQVADDLPRTVRAAIIDKQDFKVEFRLAGRFPNFFI